MDFLEFARNRWSVRSYSSRPVEEEKIEKILKAGDIAPTAVNYQPQKIYVLESDEALGKIRAITKYTYNAPLVFLVCSDTERSWKSKYIEGYESGEMDASIVGTHMMLEAENLGLGSLWILLFDPIKTAEEFNLPQNIKPHFLLAVGYKSDTAKPNASLHDSFRPQEEIVTRL